MQKSILLLGTAVVMLCSCGGSSNSGSTTDTSATTQKDTSAAAAAPAEPAVNTLSDKEKADGWVLLFDGSTKNGWHIFNKKSDGSAWKVQDGTLHLDPSNLKDYQTVGGGDLVSDSAYENFDFKVEWKIADSSNSGIIFYTQEDPKYKDTWNTGIEMQVLDNAGHPDAKIIKHRAGDLYDLISSSPETVKPANQWNQVEIISNKGNLQCFLNGTKVITTTLWDDNWKKLVAGSKFKNMKGFGTFTKGHFALQDHGNNVWYRNIKIKTL